MLSSIISWFENHMLPCQYKQIFGISCPMCGFQRSFIELLKGNFYESFTIYPAMLPIIITVVVTIVFYIYNRQKLKKVVQVMLLFDLSIMVFTCFLNNLVT